MVEVLGGSAGIVASRVGDLVLSADELRMPSWRLPEAGVDAAALDGAWWSLPPRGAAALAKRDPAAARVERRIARRLSRSPVSSMRRLIDVSVGDVTADGQPDVAVAFRRPFRTTLLNASTPRRAWVDANRLSAHVGLYRPGTLSEIWVAGTLVRPVARLAACDGALAVAYSTLRHPAIVATNAWSWHGFGFQPLPELPGAGSPTCLDIDGDGQLEAAIVERN